MEDAARPLTEVEGPSRVRLGRRLMAIGMVAVVLVSVAAWFATRETSPPRIRIATAVEGGLYYKLGAMVEPLLERRAKRPVDLLETAGTLENQELLRAGEAEIAILQDGAGDSGRLLALAPLYKDVLHVIVRRDRGYRSMEDLAGSRIAVGPRSSGMRESAFDVLEHYEMLESAEEARYFTDLLRHPELDAAIATTGLMNPDLTRLLSSGDFDVLPLRGAAALAILHPHFETFTIPRGLFNERPPVPSQDTTTVATTSYFAARSEAPGVLVTALLESLYEGDLRREIPTLLKRSEAAGWSELPLHPAARRFFQPYGGLEVLANFMESLAALKELLFALGAGLYLAWMRWRRLQEKEKEAALQADKDRLDVYLEKTIEIERLSLEVQDPNRLRSLLEEVTALKLEALRELTDEGLKGDVTFSIFLQQCSDVIRRIQTKRLRLGGGPSPPTPLPEGEGSKVRLPPAPPVDT